MPHEGSAREGGLESLDRLAEPEGMEQGHRARELLLRGRATGRREVHGAQLLGDLLGPRGDGEKQPEQDDDRGRSHCSPPWFGDRASSHLQSPCHARSVPTPMRARTCVVITGNGAHRAGGMPDAELVLPTGSWGRPALLASIAQRRAGSLSSRREFARAVPSANGHDSWGRPGFPRGATSGCSSVSEVRTADRGGLPSDTVRAGHDPRRSRSHTWPRSARSSSATPSGRYPSLSG